MAQQFPPDYFVDLISKARRLKNLRIDDVSSVDRGAGRGVDVVLIKKFPGWKSPEEWAAMRKNNDVGMVGDPREGIERVIHDLQSQKIGKDVGAMRAKRIHDDHFYNIDRRDERGRPLSDHQQFDRWQKLDPRGRRYAEASAGALQSTPDEREAEMKSDVATDRSHQHARETIGAEHHGRNEAGQMQKVDRFGVPVALKNEGIDKLNAMAEKVVQLAKRDGHQLSHAHAFTLVLKCDGAKDLLRRDWEHRGISAGS
jgi:hypothetical protein